MERRSERILAYILRHTEDGKYKVLGVPRLIRELKLPDTAVTRRQIVGMVKAFVDSEYIGCKFYDEENICAVAMPAGRVWLSDSGRRDETRKGHWKTALITFLCALAGGFVGALLAALLPL